jgi:negative regulator of flagellin synthesis FlgM
MRVSPTSSNQIQGTETSKANQTSQSRGARRPERSESSESSSTESSSARGDVNASISSKARDLASAKAAATSAPDVREERIAELKRKIASGSYHVDADKVADRLVDDHIKMSGIG